jgi:hypothetical protein
MSVCLPQDPSRALRLLEEGDHLGGFDAIVGNPPYIRMQALGRELADYCLVGAVALLVALTGQALPATGLRRREDKLPGVALGRVRSTSRPSRVGLDELQEGVFLLGSPGAGKTNLLLVLARRLPPGIGLAFVDLKGRPLDRDEARDRAEQRLRTRRPRRRGLEPARDREPRELARRPPRRRGVDRAPLPPGRRAI